MPPLVRVDASNWWLSTGCMDTSQAGPAVSGIVVTTSPMLRLAVAAYLARFKEFELDRTIRAPIERVFARLVDIEGRWHGKHAQAHPANLSR